MPTSVPRPVGVKWVGSQQEVISLVANVVKVGRFYPGWLELLTIRDVHDPGWLQKSFWNDESISLPKSSVILTLEETPNRDWEISHGRKFHLLPFRFMAGFWYALFYKCLGRVFVAKTLWIAPQNFPKDSMPCPCFIDFLLLKFGWMICSRLFYRAVSPGSLYLSSLHRFVWM